MTLLNPADQARRDRMQENVISDWEESEKEYKAPYTQLKRGYGMGNCRIGKNIRLNDDIYSLAYSCQIKDSIIYDAIGEKPTPDSDDELTDSE